MDIATVGELAGIGLVGGFMAGFLGIGGGIIIIPLLMYGAGLPIGLAAGISMVQAFFATLSGLVIHRRNRTVNLKLGLILGSASVIGALLGAFGSALLSSHTMLQMYMLLLLLSLVLLLVAPRAESPKSNEVNLWVTLPIGFGVGVLAGILGVGGGFVMIPLMISVLRVPTRVAVGTSLVVILMTTVAGSTGKIATGQFDPQIAAWVILGSIFGAQLGGRASSLVSPRVLRLTMGLLLVGIIIRTGMDLIAA